MKSTIRVFLYLMIALVIRMDNGCSSDNNLKMLIPSFNYVSNIWVNGVQS